MLMLAPHLQLEYQEHKKKRIALCTLYGIAPNNSLDENLLDEILSVMQTAAKNAEAIIFSSAHEKFFSNGLDGNTLLAASPEQRARIVEKMIRLCPELLKIEKPWVAEMSGYAMAGGAVIASSADYRYMLAHGGRISFSELAVGLPLPLAYVKNLQSFVAPAALRFLMEANAYKPADAERIGLIDATAETRESLRMLSLKKIDAILRIDQKAYLDTRNRYRQELVRQVEQGIDEDVEQAKIFARSLEFENVLRVIAEKNRSKN